MPVAKVDSNYYHDQSERLAQQRPNDPAETPWTPMPKPLSECKVTLVSTAGIFVKGDEPFDYGREWAEPSWGDPSHREIPRTAGQDDVVYSHLHIDTSFLTRDRNVAWPVDIFNDYEKEGKIGALANTLYSIMGYIPNFSPLIKRTAPLMVESMKAQCVDVAFIVPV
jgi:D-proline reductase (dithiol) PrdB